MGENFLKQANQPEDDTKSRGSMHSHDHALVSGSLAKRARGNSSDMGDHFLNKINKKETDTSQTRPTDARKVSKPSSQLGDNFLNRVNKQPDNERNSQAS